MHIEIFNQSQIELLKSINPILGEYKIPKKVLYEMEFILRYEKKRNSDYIAFIMNPVKNDTTAILKELWLYEQEIEIADNNFHLILKDGKKHHGRTKKNIWTWFDIVLPSEGRTIFVVYPMKRKDLYRKKEMMV